MTDDFHIIEAVIIHEKRLMRSGFVCVFVVYRNIPMRQSVCVCVYVCVCVCVGVCVCVCVCVCMCRAYVCVSVHLCVTLCVRMLVY